MSDLSEEDEPAFLAAAEVCSIEYQLGEQGTQRMTSQWVWDLG